MTKAVDATTVGPSALFTERSDPTGRPHIRSRTDFEDILFDPLAVGAMGRVSRPLSEAWSAEFPDLTSLPRGQGEPAPLSICIATEDIVGPVQNGGIGSTYASLAAMLSAAGHKTTILYLPGQGAESESAESYVKDYAELGVRLVHVPNYAARDGLSAPKDRWLRIPYNMMRFLAENPFDVVHVSEWRGSGFLSLLAKRQGLAFQKTLFVVKTSSPWLWNRMYCSQPLERPEELSRIFAERRSVELADVVVGGSAHLLRWMLSHGYRLPPHRTFVQPNFIAQGAASRPNRQKPGTRMPIEELVFFGRLEGRKGLLLFCHAIARLIRLDVKLPPTITFLGKAGVRLSARPDQTVIDFIETETQDWPCHVQILSDLQQPEAVEYLVSGPRLAVMPSLIENSSMAVYEATILGIPFLASRVGGTPELIRARDHEHVLLSPHPIEIADKIAEALDKGGYFAAPSFDNGLNIETWRNFHDDLGRGLKDHLLGTADHDGQERSIGICIYHPGDMDALTATFSSLDGAKASEVELLIAVDAQERGAVDQVRAQLARGTIQARVFDTADRDAGASFNQLVEASTSVYVLILWAGMLLEPLAFEKLRTLVTSSDADAFNFFYRHGTDPQARRHPLTVDMVGSLSDGFVSTQLMAQPLLVRRSAFIKAGRFSTDYRCLGHEQEFLAKAQLAGLVCETALMELASVPALSRKWLWDRGYDEVASYLRGVRPQIATAPMPVRDLLLLAKGLIIKPVVNHPRAGAAPRARKGVAGLSLPQAVKLATQSRFGTVSLKVRKEKKARAAAGVPGAPNAPMTSARFITDPTATKAPTLQGRTLFVQAGTIHGWAIDRSDPDRLVMVEAVEDGRVIATAPANRLLPLPDGGSRPEISHCGFALNPFESWKGRLGRRNRTVTVDVRIAGTTRYAARKLVVFSPSAVMDRTSYEGFCDRSNDGVVQGWVRSTTGSDEEIDVAILLDGVLIGRARADHYRDDLVANDVGSGEHGFRFKLAESLRTGRPQRVEVCIAQNGLRLNRSPLVVKARTITPRAPLFNWLP